MSRIQVRGGLRAVRLLVCGVPGGSVPGGTSVELAGPVIGGVLPSWLWVTLQALKLRSRYSADEDPVFAARNGKPLMHRNATARGFELAAKRAGIEGVSPSIRCGTRSLRA